MDLPTRLRGIYERFAAGDPRPMAEFLADDVIYHLPGKHLGGGTLHGRVAVLECAAKAALDCEPPPSISVIASAEFAVSLERFTARRRGRTLDQEVSVVWRITRDRGQCVEIWSHFANQGACDLFWQDV